MALVRTIGRAPEPRITASPNLAHCTQTMVERPRTDWAAALTDESFPSDRILAVPFESIRRLRGRKATLFRSAQERFPTLRGSIPTARSLESVFSDVR
jgi:hypothetical protein